VAEVFEDAKGLTNPEFRSVLPRALEALHPGMTQFERSSLIAGAEKTIPNLTITNNSAVQFFGPKFDAKAFVANRERIRGLLGVDNDPAAAALTDIYGSRIGRYLGPVTAKKVPLRDALDAVPSPTVGNKDGLADYMDHRIGTLGILGDAKAELRMLKDIGGKWSTLPPELKQLDAEDLAFRIRTGISKEEYRASSTPPLTVRDDGRNFYARVNNAPAGSLFRSFSGDTMNINALVVDRRLHIGQTLMTEAERTAPANVTVSELNVGLQNRGAQRLYGLLGYKPYRNSGSIIFMQKPLVPRQ
jgi:hypothetical protein